MVAALKLRETPEQKYLEKGLREGWIKVHLDIGMNRIVVRPELQGRVLHYNMDHVRFLGRKRDMGSGEFLEPVVVYLMPSGEFLLADGFHRWKENLARGGVFINAYVVNVPDYEEAATLYASMCNQCLSLPRTKDDERKVVELVLARPGCKSWTVKQIADHCGVSEYLTEKYQREYAIRNKADLRPGKPRKAKATLVAVAPTVLSPGTDPDDDVSMDDLTHPPLGNTSAFRMWLLYRGVKADTIERSCAGMKIRGCLASGRSIVLCPTAVMDDVKLAIADAVLLGGLSTPDTRPILVLIKQKPKSHQRVYELATKRGIDFVEPQELVEILKDAQGREATHGA